MKGGRSNRHDPPDDWVDGSWTVDCVCGVNFDDGEEMVNCDECGVWVHTRCSRYVKGEELFTCDKCKSKNNRNDSEETEVAQLLVELPTKTIRLERNFSSNVAPRRPFKLWTERPMEDRVHVQGIPGGDPALFHGLSSVFTPQLWKCTGYVPKKFNFQYREFPCWDEKEGDGRNEEENENTVDKGAGVLFSLSKESMLATPVAALVGMRGRDDEGACDMKSYSKDMKRLEVEDRDVGRSQVEVKRDRSLLQPVVIHSGKRKKEDLGKFNYQSGKKKVRAADKEMDLKKRGSHVSKTALTSTNDSKTLEFYEDRGLKGFKNDTQSTKNQTIQEHEYDGHVIVGNCVEKQKNNSDMAGNYSEAFSFDAPKHMCSTPTELKEGKVNGEMPTVTNNYPKVDNVAASGLSNNDVVNTSLELEGVSMHSGNKDDHVNNFAGIDVKPSVDGVSNAACEAEEKLINGHGDSSLSSIKPSVKSEGNDDMFKRVLNTQHSLGDAKDAGLSYHNVCEKVNDATLGTSSSSDHKAIEVDKTPEVVGDSRTEKPDELIGRTCLRHELEGSEASMPLQKCPSESKCGSVFADELLKSEGTIFDSPALTSQRKMVVCIGKSSSSSSMIMLSKTSASDNLRSADTLNSNPDTHRAMSEGTSSIKKDQAASDVVRDSERHEISRKMVKEHSKSSVNSVSKTSNLSKISHTPVPKRTVSDSKGSSMYASPKPPNSGETSAPLQSDTSHTQNKAPSSGLPLRAEKFNQSHSHSSSKANHVSPMNPHAPTSSPATLSDEELALLLHQELNSSPRVPRVPRVRNAGSIPQLASPTATSMLVKCTSSSAGKDHSSVVRRKSKDASKAGFHHSQNSVDETKGAERGPSSPDRRRHGIRYSTDGLSKREDYGSAAAGNSTKKNVPPTSTSTANSGPSSSTEVNDHHLSSMRNSPRNVSEEEAGTVRAPVRRTLPGLINEIMSKGKRMTYEELCNAVLPHWHNLRKHNGERYAYSSHSQAVLDCLRNRQEWARLVDRGPKTNSSRKKRRLDTEESEEIEYRKGRTTETKSLESQKEEFPKGKRKARKRRRLALQGRGIKDVRNKRKAGMASDDDSDPFSNTSGETLFSDEEIQGGGAGSVGSETSSSSDDASSM